jgi:thiol:disulfide interchange protein
MRKLILYVFYLTLFLKTNFILGQIDLPKDKVKVTFSVEQTDCNAYLVANVNIEKGWHINSIILPSNSNSIPTKFNVNTSKGISITSEVIEPKPKTEYDQYIKETLSYHEGKFSIKRKIIVKTDRDNSVSGSFSFQTCNEYKCLPIDSFDFNLKIKGCQEDNNVNSGKIETEDKAEKLQINIPDSIKKSKSTINNQKERKNESLLAIFIISFLSGIAALLTPCVFPMIPMTVSFFTNSNKKKVKGIRNAFLYGLSIIIIYVLLGTIVTTVFGPTFLNSLATNAWFNIFFFILLVVFATSFLGAFDISLPSSWLNIVSKFSDKGGIIGIFFMAFTLALVSFSCTGPIVGTLLVQSASVGGVAPLVGMLGFSLALALPFTLFAAFPGWMNSLPKSGGWLNTVKVFLGFIELAFAFKFLSNADLVTQSHLLERELFLSIWIGIFSVLTIYLFGGFKMKHDSPIEKLSVGRALLGTTSFVFVIYLIPGLWGAPLKVISGFPPPLNYKEWKKNSVHDLIMFNDYDKALAYAKEKNKPIMLDFTGWACNNCRKMEETVWIEDEVFSILKNDVVVVSLYTDEKTLLPREEQKKSNRKTIGEKWSYLQINKYGSNSQPHYRMLTPDGVDLSNGPADYEHHHDDIVFKRWLEKGIEEFENMKKE